MNLELDLDFENAYLFYKEFILEQSQKKSEIYQKYGFSLEGSVGPRDWEVFAAILLKDQKKPADSSDLENYEIKSAKEKGSFEYQYHRNTGLQKLSRDKEIDHIFISYSKNYKNVEIFLIKKTNAKLQEIFSLWEPELQKNYKKEEKQRFRKSLPHGFVRQGGVLLLTIEDGVLQEVQKAGILS